MYLSGSMLRKYEGCSSINLLGNRPNQTLYSFNLAKIESTSISRIRCPRYERRVLARHMLCSDQEPLMWVDNTGPTWYHAAKPCCCCPRPFLHTYMQDMEMTFIHAFRRNGRAGYMSIRMTFLCFLGFHLMLCLLWWLHILHRV